MGHGILPTLSFLRPHGADGYRCSGTTVSLLDDVCLQAERTDDAMKLEEKSAGVAQRVSFWVTTP
jgi:hypothetical protein